MKRFVNIFKGFAAIAVMAFAFVSCSKQKSEELSVVGDWKAEYATQKYYENDVLKTEEIYYLDNDVMLVSINADGTACVITYEKDDNYVYMKTKCMAIHEVLSYYKDKDCFIAIY